METQFTEGRTQYHVAGKALYEKSRKAVPELPPTLEEAFKMGVVKKYFPENHIAYKDFRENPEAHPLPSPSGKIEIYSPRLAELAKTWTLLPEQAITPLPEYIPNPEGPEGPGRKTWPLQLIGHHYKQRTHSTYGNCWWLQEVAPQELWINPRDAGARGIRLGDRVKVFNERGVSFVKAKVTPRIMPGVVSPAGRRVAHARQFRAGHQRLRQRADQAAAHGPGQRQPPPHQPRPGRKSLSVKARAPRMTR